MKPLAKYIYCLFSFLIVGLTSCDNEVCKESMYTALNLDFEDSETKGTSSLNNVSVFRVNANRLDSTKYKDVSSLAVFDLSLNPASDESRFFIKCDNFRDTLVIKHTNICEYVSAECGARYIYNIDTAYLTIGFGIDSIVISNPIVKGVKDAKNVKIYR